MNAILLAIILIIAINSAIIAITELPSAIYHHHN